jgi:hypothetical protein
MLSGWNARTKQVVDVEYGSDGSRFINSWTVKSPTLEEGERTGFDSEGKVLKSKVRIEKKPESYKWTETERTEDGTSLPDLVVEVSRVASEKVAKGQRRQGARQQKSPIPEDVRATMDYLAGFWRLKATINDSALQGTMSVRWSSGQTCQVYNSRGWEKGDRKNATHGTIICGYDPVKDQAVETAYHSDGGFTISRYNMKPHIVDEGVITGERTAFLRGEDIKGTIRVERESRDKFFWAFTDEAGEKVQLDFQRAEAPKRQKKAEK